MRYADDVQRDVVLGRRVRRHFIEVAITLVVGWNPLRRGAKIPEELEQMTERIFPHWESFYRERDAETMPWYFDGLDPDFAIELDTLGIAQGRVLDIGTGAGAQAIELARRGFEVTATDIAEAAIEHARKTADARGAKIELLVDDVLDSHVDGIFDVVFDRGCFHTLAPERRTEYVAMVAKHTREGGHLLLKCFSHLQPGDVGPHKFTPAELEACFAAAFVLRSARETVYQGTLDPLPRAMSCVLTRTAS